MACHAAPPQRPSGSLSAPVPSCTGHIMPGRGRAGTARQTVLSPPLPGQKSSPFSLSSTSVLRSSAHPKMLPLCKIGSGGELDECKTSDQMILCTDTYHFAPIHLCCRLRSPPAAPTRLLCRRHAHCRQRASKVGIDRHVQDIPPCWQAPAMQGLVQPVRACVPLPGSGLPWSSGASTGRPQPPMACGEGVEISLSV